MKLKDLLRKITPTAATGDMEVEIADVCIDSRAARPGSLFVAVRGTNTDGHAYIRAAVEQGAAAIICETLPEGTDTEGTTYVAVKDSAEAAGQVATAFYGYPSEQLKLVGVTGTNGKTTVATVLHDLMESMGSKAGLLSTVCNRIGNRTLPADHTTPDPITLNCLLAEMVKEGCQYAFMEVSSHAVDQKRIAGLKFAGGIFTNLTRDHLDYHKTVENYLKAKKTFFDQLPPDAFCLTCLDDKNGRVMTQNTRARIATYATRGMADFTAHVLEEHTDGMLLDVDGREVAVYFIGRFNAQNLLAVTGAAVLLGKDEDETLRTLSSLHPVAGRLERLGGGGKPTVFVDYAHTPDALVNVMDTLRDVMRGRGQLIAVVGAGGNRDKGKRPLMAQAAAARADRLIVTSDNPRFEDPEDIMADMLAGLQPDAMAKTLAIADRRQAIRTACLTASPADVVLIAGKGHEDYQEVKGVKHHFDDREEARAALGSIKINH